MDACMSVAVNGQSAVDEERWRPARRHGGVFSSSLEVSQSCSNRGTAKSDQMMVHASSSQPHGIIVPIPIPLPLRRSIGKQPTATSYASASPSRTSARPCPRLAPPLRRSAAPRACVVCESALGPPSERAYGSPRSASCQCHPLPHYYTTTATATPFVDPSTGRCAYLGPAPK
jgi:hypothetical protein